MLKMSKKGIFSLFLTFSLFISVIFSCPVVSGAQTLSELQSEQSELKEKIKTSEEKVAKLEKEKAKQSDIISELNTQIDKLNSQLENIRGQKNIISGKIDKLQEEIDKLNDEITELDNQILEKEDEIQATVELYCERMRANYIAGDVSLLQMFADSSGVASFLNRIELFKRVVDSDQQLVNKLNDEITKIENMKKTLEEKKQKLNDDKSELESEKSELVASEQQLNDTQTEIIEKSRQVNEKLASIKYQTKQLEVSIDKYNSDMDAVESEITAFLKEQERKSSNQYSYSPSVSSSPTSSGWTWPVPYSSSYISSPYGYRNDPISGVYKFHAGIDITMADAYGKNLVAAKAGTVIRVIYGSTGYGIYLMIDHGGGWVSLYGHCSSINVSVGQYVSQGQVVAHIGSSGYATGAHVHFEIRYNGEKVNPSNYVSH